MVLIVAAVSIVVIGIGLYGLCSPGGLAAFALRWKSLAGLWTASEAEE